MASNKKVVKSFKSLVELIEGKTHSAEDTTKISKPKDKKNGDGKK